MVAGEQRIFSRQGNRSGEILDGIAIHLDAPVAEEELETIPVSGGTGELLAEAGFGRDAGALLLQPVAEGLDQGRAACLPFGETPLGRAAADIALDGKEFGDPAQAFGPDLGAAAVVDFSQFSPAMRPTIRKLYRRAALPAPAGQPVVTGISIELQDAVEALQERFGMFAAAPGGVEVHDAQRIGPACGSHKSYLPQKS